jgi:type VII secretion integral membrane protein EccD
MSSTDVTDLCRITVLGPARKVDLAVPHDTTVATLLPIMLGHTGEPDQLGEDGEPNGSWVLQRLGGPPLDPDGTPGSLDLLEGEELYLRPAEDSLPDLDFDDIADAIATAANRQKDRWRPEFGYRLFLTLSAVVTGVIVAILMQPGPLPGRAVGSGVLALAFAVATALAGKQLKDRVITTLTGMASCGLAALTGFTLRAGAEHGAAFDPAALAAGLTASVIAVTGAALLLLTLHWLLVDEIPVAPFTGLLMIAAAVSALQGTQLLFGLTPSQTAGLTSAFLLVVVVFAPRIVIRLSRLRGPQLPRTSDELQQDIEPVTAEEVLPQAARADRFLTVVLIGVSVAYAVSFEYLVDGGSWIGQVLTGVFSAALLLRARNLLGAWQRVSVTAAGTWGMILVVLSLTGASPAVRIPFLVVLVILLGVLITAALRPPQRRMLPIWGHTANVLDTVAGIIVTPLLLQLLGVYAWARGLAG